MHAFLIAGTDNQINDDEISKICKNTGANRLDFDIGGIADVRQLGNFVKLSQKNRIAIILKDIQNFSDEASNSLLKLIEEPGENIIYILLTKNLNSVLPTIVSRCQVKITQGQNFSASSEKVLNFIKADANHRLLLVDTVKSPEDAKLFIAELTRELHSKLLENPKSKIVRKALDEAVFLNKNLSLNGNPTLHLTRYVVRI